MTQFLNSFGKRILQEFKDSISSGTDSYYVFGAKTTPWNNEPQIDPEVNTQEEINNIRSELVFGKKITTNDLTFIIKKKYWEANRTYDQYDHRVDLTNKNYYVINSQNHVYKCLYNNNNSPSTVEPTNISTFPVELSDGYIWKYMFSISSGNNTKFSTTDYIPIDANTTVEDAAIKGSIDVILVENSGLGYDFVSGTIQEVINTKTFRLENSLPIDNDRYKDSSIYITSGTGIGSLAVIESYVANSSGKYIITKTDMNLDLTSSYLISPQVKISGDGSGATAFCEGNSVDGSIEKIVVETIGSGYSWANVEIIANTSFGSGGTATAIISPDGGHGSDPVDELNAEYLMLSVDIDKDEGGTISTDVDFRQIGIIHNPTQYNSNNLYTASTFNNLTRLNIIPQTGTFAKNEIVKDLTTGAFGTVTFANTSVVDLVNVSGNFEENNYILGETTGASASISLINNPDIDACSGEILYFENIEAVQRNPNSLETITLLIKV